MATNSDRNLSFEQAQAMWPGSTFKECEQIRVDLGFPTIKDMQEHFKLGNSDGWGATDDPRFAIKNTTGLPQLPAQLDSHAEKMAKEAVKLDNGKPDWSLVPFEALEGMVRVLEFGANKYQAYNFAKGGGLDYTRLISATIRHISAFARGEDIDHESGLSHIHHCQCNLLFISYFIAHKEKYTKNDNRYKI